MICLAVTEPSAGSDVANIKTSAKLSADKSHYVVNGEKKWITNGIWADFFTVAVRTGGEGMKGISLLLLEKSMPGITCRKMKCSGVWCSGTTYISFENVIVPAANLIGKENKGFKYIVHNFNYERVIICAQAIASARCCYEEAWKHAHRRKTFGKALIEHQVIRFKLGEMIRGIESCQYWLDNLAFQVETMHHREADYKLGGTTALLKVQCTKVLEFCVREAAQIFGGLSFSRGGMGEKVERLSREVRSLAIPGGSEEIMIDLGVRMSTKIAQLGHQIQENGPMFAKQLALAKKVGVNTEIFGDGNPFADPSWYQTYNTVFYNESHKRLRGWMRNLCEKLLVPNITEWDEAGQIPLSILSELYGEGIGCLAAGPPYSGVNLSVLSGVKIDPFHELVAIDEISRIASGGVVGVLWTGVSSTVSILRSAGGGKFFDDVVNQVLKGQKRIALAVAEPDVSGHDLSKISTSLNPDNTLTGVKNYVTNGGLADYYIVAARQGVSGDSISLVLVERGTAGGVTVEKMKCTGCWSSATAVVRFENAKILAVVGQPGQGASLLDASLDHERWVMAVESIRFARVCYEEALKHAGVREAFGKKLIHHQGIRFKLGEMARQIEGAFAWLEMITYQLACRKAIAHSPDLGGAIALLKLHSTKLFEYCAREASQILGSLSYTRGGAGGKVERLNREVRAIALTFGSEEVLLDQGVKKIQKLAVEAKKRIKDQQSSESSATEARL